MVADEVADDSLRSALNNLSDESCCYAGELKNYLKVFGIYSPINEAVNINDLLNYESPVTENPEKGNELQSICSYNEESLIRAYSELLQESFPFQVLKDIMHYQLNALKYTFMKIKTLNTARFSAC